MPVADRKGIAESRMWCARFAANGETDDEIPWDDEYRLAPDEREAIEASVQQFQLGEGSQGRRLLRRGEAFATAAEGDPDFVAALRLFVAEEQRHSEYLRRFMEREGISVLSKHWVDWAFRRFRALAGLELALRVLVTAEIIAVPYYRALRGATKSPVLRAISTRILRDEAGHLAFQASMLARLGAGRHRVLRRAVRTTHAVFLAGTAALVWATHRRVFAAARKQAGSFLREALGRLRTLERARPAGRGSERAQKGEEARSPASRGRSLRSA